ncbi:MAG: NifU family protein, partial [Bacillota bacterium]
MENSLLKDKVEKALEKIRSALQAHGGDVVLVSADGGV